jgi:hypothetical protein
MCEFMTAFTQPGLHKTQVTGFARLALWAGWLALVALLLVTFAAGVPVRYSHLAVGVEPDDSTLIGELYSTIAVDRLGPQEMHALNGLGLSQRFYAGFILTFEVGLALVCAAIGIFIFWQRPDNWLTLWVSLILVVLGTNGPWTIVPALATVWPYGMWISVLAGALGMISHVHLLFLSPDGRFVPRWTQRIAAGFTGGLLALIFLIGAFFERWGFQTSLALVFLTFLIWMILLGLGVYSQVYRYRRISSPVQRQQTKWLAVGLTTVALGFVINALLVYLSPQSGLPRLMYNLIRPPVVTLFMMLFPVCLGFSILRYRL